MAKSGAEPGDISGEISARFDYDLGRSVDDIRPGYEFDVSCAGSVPEAIICALQAADYEDAVRNAVSIGGDSDTIACIAGGIAEATRGYLTDDLTAQLDRFKSAVPGKVR